MISMDNGRWTTVSIITCTIVIFAQTPCTQITSEWIQMHIYQ
jgi:hypothetical protein